MCLVGLCGRGDNLTRVYSSHVESGLTLRMSHMDAGHKTTPAKAVLQALRIGSSVAEHDEALARYFVETETFRRMIRDEGDVVAGDKGTGKTALFRILLERYRGIPELGDVEIVPAFNPQGTPIFQRILETDGLTELHYLGVWKAYFFSLVGNWILSVYDEPDWSDRMRRLDRLLVATELRSSDDSASTIFSKLANLIKRLLRPKTVETGVGFSEVGMPMFTAKLELGDEGTASDGILRHDDALQLVDSALGDLGFKVWLILDRLDEAFQSRPNHETPALRALLRAYLDIQNLSSLRCKIFVRKDLFRRITRSGFVNLTHVNARKIEIVWDTDDLYDLLSRRVKESTEFIALTDLRNADADEVFTTLFPNQVDQGERKPVTWSWIMQRIRDGNGVRPPRNLIDLVLRAQESQLRQEDRTKSAYRRGTPLIGSDALKRGLDALSETRVQDTLLAEAGDYAELIERFRDGKAEHNSMSLEVILGRNFKADVKALEQLGFLEPVGSNWKIPMLYRAGMRITQGRAYGPGDSESNEEDGGTWPAWAGD
jgi:hypothetical protein